MTCKKCGRWEEGKDCPSTLNPSCECGIPKADELLCCPRCGGDGGFILKKTMCYEHWFDWSGAAVSYEGTNGQGGKRKYCADCRKDITAFVVKMECEGRITT